MKHSINLWAKVDGYREVVLELSPFDFQVIRLQMTRGGMRMPAFRATMVHGDLMLCLKGRALLMLFLFSDIGPNDAPTRILVGSHLDVPPLLEPYGEDGLSFIELAQKLTTTLNRDVELATGKAGTVFLCHPFLIHAAQDNKVGSPRFLAQPPLLPAEPINLNRQDEDVFPR